MPREKRTSFKDLPQYATELILKKKITVRKLPKSKNDKPKYNADERKIYVTEDYDLLRYNILVRPYICKKFKIEVALLDILLYLYPLQLFAYKDYVVLPRPFHYRNPKIMLTKGIFVIAIEGRLVSENVYALSPKFKKIVRAYYEFLTLEKIIPNEDPENSVFKNQGRGNNHKRTKMIEVLNKTTPDPLRKYFE